MLGENRKTVTLRDRGHRNPGTRAQNRKNRYPLCTLFRKKVDNCTQQDRRTAIPPINPTDERKPRYEPPR